MTQESHLREELATSHDVINHLHFEVARQRQIINSMSKEHSADVARISAELAAAECQICELIADNERLHAENQVLHEALSEANRERERLLGLFSNVRESVDAELERLCNELRTHKDREEKLRLLNKDLEAQLEESQKLQHKQLGRKEITEVTPESVMSMYREWAADFERDVFFLDETLEKILDELSDVKSYFEGSQPSHQDRQRLHSMRAMDRDRINAHRETLIATHADDAAALTVHAIRSHCDTSRYVLARTKAAAASVASGVKSLRPLRPPQTPPPLPPHPAAVAAEWAEGTTAEGPRARAEGAKAEVEASRAKAEAARAEASEARAEAEVAHAAARDADGRAKAAAEEAAHLRETLRTAISSHRAECERIHKDAMENDKRHAAAVLSLHEENREKFESFRLAAEKQIAQAQLSAERHEQNFNEAQRKCRENQEALMLEKSRSSELESALRSSREEKEDLLLTVRAQRQEIREAQALSVALRNEIHALEATMSTAAQQNGALDVINAASRSTSAFVQWKRGFAQTKKL